MTTIHVNEAEREFLARFCNKASENHECDGLDAGHPPPCRCTCGETFNDEPGVQHG